MNFERGDRLLGFFCRTPLPVKASLRFISGVVTRGMLAVAVMRGKRVVPAFWAQALNFGDMLTPELLKSYGVLPRFTPCIGKVCSGHTLVSCGSILGWLRKDFRGYVIGSGLGGRGEAKFITSARFLAVRGKRTRDAMGLDSRVLLGDPGLLVERVMKCAGIAKTHLMGVVPHQSEQDSPLVGQLISRLENGISKGVGAIKLISTRRFPRAVVADIASCQYILSSSLHGLVIADALSIPSARVHIDATIADFKFEDYFSAYDESCETHEASEILSFDDAVSICKFPAARGRIIATLKEGLESAYEKYLREAL